VGIVAMINHSKVKASAALQSHGKDESEEEEEEVDDGIYCKIDETSTSGAEVRLIDHP